MKLKGLTIDEYCSILDLVKNTPHLMKRLGIKSIESTFDYRLNEISSITFKKGDHEGVCFSCYHFSGYDVLPADWKYLRLYSLAMAYLQLDFLPTPEFYINKG